MKILKFLSMFRFGFVSLGVMLLASGMAAVEAQELPERPEQIEFQPLEFDPPLAEDYRHELENGVPVYIAESSEFPLVTVSFIFKGGAYLESADEVGLAAITGQMLREGGTETMTPAEVDERLDFLAANLSIGVGDTRGSASLNCLKFNLDESMSIMLELLRRPAWNADRLRLAKAEAIEMMKQRNDSPDDILNREWAALMWGRDHFEGRVATEGTIQSITPETMEAFRTRLFHPGNLMIGVVGDVTPEEILPRLEKAMEGWEIGALSEDPPAPETSIAKGIYVIEKDTPQGKVRLGSRGVTRDHPDALALQVMNYILGGSGFTSRLMNTIRSDEGLSYGVSSAFSNRVEYPGEFRTGFASKNSTVALAIQLALKEIRGMTGELVTEDEIKIAKQSLIETFPRNFESKSAMISVFINDEMTDRPDDFWQNYRDRVQSMTRERLQEVAQEHLKSDEFAIMVVGKWEEIQPGDVDGRASMNDFESYPVQELPLRDPLTQEPLD